MAQQTSREKPSVIFLDAVGTLFGVQGSVGQVYGNLARQFGVDIPADTIDHAFYQSFRAAGAPTFSAIDPVELQAKEFAWWMEIATSTFKQLGVFNQFHDFAAFFAELYAHFGTADPWFIYPDVLPALNAWRHQGIQLGILSNFDSRIYSVLDALDLSHFFASITISTQAGFAKPDRQIFTIALQKHLCPPEWAWHIGDRYDEDYQAACAVGMRGIWLRRKE
jgi:putative hydrolase of the HAD superfamily